MKFKIVVIYQEQKRVVSDHEKKKKANQRRDFGLKFLDSLWHRNEAILKVLCTKVFIQTSV